MKENVFRYRSLSVCTVCDTVGNKLIYGTRRRKKVSLIPTVEDKWTSVAYGNGMFVAVNGRGSVQTSSDGSTWTSRLEGRYKYSCECSDYFYAEQEYIWGDTDMDEVSVMAVRLFFEVYE